MKKSYVRLIRRLGCITALGSRNLNFRKLQLAEPMGSIKLVEKVVVSAVNPSGRKQHSNLYSLRGLVECSTLCPVKTRFFKLFRFINKSSEEIGHLTDFVFC